MTGNNMNNQAVLDEMWRRSEASVDVPVAPLNADQETVRQRVLQRYDSGYYDTESSDCICGSRNDTRLLPRDRYGLPSPSAICVSCGIIRTTPRLTRDSLDRFYDIDYRPLYVGSRTGLQEYFQRQVIKGQGVRRFVGDAIGKRGSVVDIGCGAGGFLLPFHDQGWKAIGCDLGSHFLTEGAEKGLDLRQGSPSIVRSEGPFDLVIMSHVVEHVPDPVDFLRREVVPLIKTDGFVYMETPGLLRLGRYGDPLRYFQNAHLYNFTLENLVDVAGASGLVLVKGDQQVRALFRLGMPGPGTVRANCYGAVYEALVRAERRRRVTGLQAQLRQAAMRIVPVKAGQKLKFTIRRR